MPNEPSFTLKLSDAVSAFADIDLDYRIKFDLFNNSEPLAEEINQRIRARTAKDTGALRKDEVYEIHYDSTEEDMVDLYISGEHEVEEWGRTYGRFIEGPTLGESSPTIKDPSHMYALVEFEDVDLIDQWAGEELGMTIDTIVSEVGGG